MASCSVYKLPGPLGQDRGKLKVRDLHGYKLLDLSESELPHHPRSLPPMGNSILPPPTPMEPRNEYAAPRLPPPTLGPMSIRSRQTETLNRSSLEYILDNRPSSPPRVAAPPSSGLPPFSGSPRFPAPPSSSVSPFDYQPSGAGPGLPHPGGGPSYDRRASEDYRRHDDRARHYSNSVHYGYGNEIPDSRAPFYGGGRAYDERPSYDDPRGYGRHDERPRRYDAISPYVASYERDFAPTPPAPAYPAGSYGSVYSPPAGPSNWTNMPPRLPSADTRYLDREADNRLAGDDEESSTRSRGAKPKKRRGNLPKEATDVMRSWLLLHLESPFPSDEEKREMERITRLNPNQVANWFINARRRHVNGARALAGLPPLEPQNGGKKSAKKASGKKAGGDDNAEVGPSSLSKGAAAGRRRSAGEAFGSSDAEELEDEETSSSAGEEEYDEEDEQLEEGDGGDDEPLSGRRQPKRRRRSLVRGERKGKGRDVDA